MNSTEQPPLAPTPAHSPDASSGSVAGSDTDEQLKLELTVFGLKHAANLHQADTRFVGRKILLAGTVRTITGVHLHADGKTHLTYDLHGNDIQLHAFKGMRFVP